jgi:hypothetical protein
MVSPGFQFFSHMVIEIIVIWIIVREIRKTKGVLTRFEQFEEEVRAWMANETTENPIEEDES